MSLVEFQNLENTAIISAEQDATADIPSHYIDFTKINVRPNRISVKPTDSDCIMILNHTDPSNLSATDFTSVEHFEGRKVDPITAKPFAVFHLTKDEVFQRHYTDADLTNICFQSATATESVIYLAFN